MPVRKHAVNMRIIKPLKSTCKTFAFIKVVEDLAKEQVKDWTSIKYEKKIIFKNRK